MIEHEQLSKLEPVYVEERVYALPNLGQNLCALHEYHSPEVTSFDVHHVFPQGAGGPDIDSNKVIVCPTGHRNVHTLIRLLDKIGVEAVDRSSWGEKTWDMALKGWEEMH